MRKLMMLNVLPLCSVILLGCSTGSETPISQSDIPDLIGTWEGRYSGSRWASVIRVQILNDFGIPTGLMASMMEEMSQDALEILVTQRKVLSTAKGWKW
jgi:hypothetical protein